MKCPGCHKTWYIFAAPLFVGLTLMPEKLFEHNEFEDKIRIHKSEDDDDEEEPC